MLFNKALAEHQRRKDVLQLEQDTATRAALAAVPRLAGALVDVANADVSQIYDLQLEIEAEGAAVRAAVAALQRNLAAVAGAVRHCSEALKQLGDFENYVEVLEQKVDKVTSALLASSQQQQQQQQQQQHHHHHQQAPR
ncbi:hypothetical protein HYH02_007991 [Chlamydomonas schloesseri]|uniref:Biogenesis of lysosome-related organelles complex 1 subunit 1 n=1 Tax=Chlamydomonas schloesseri TaxID=2026947 RepID=A0A835WH02_9CHLO|nr:hypothetical protein HYH02_007991 [Chlamydomonas schloesseri]|eukprot:KAG2447251.1 hypothetical protein HYH02_007991 [Chlamydomonas schloesseri]